MKDKTIEQLYNIVERNQAIEYQYKEIVKSDFSSSEVLVFLMLLIETKKFTINDLKRVGISGNIIAKLTDLHYYPSENAHDYAVRLSKSDELSKLYLDYFDTIITKTAFESLSLESANGLRLMIGIASTINTLNDKFDYKVLPYRNLPSSSIRSLYYPRTSICLSTESIPNNILRRGSSKKLTMLIDYLSSISGTDVDIIDYHTAHVLHEGVLEGFFSIYEKDNLEDLFDREAILIFNNSVEYSIFLSLIKKSLPSNMTLDDSLMDKYSSNNRFIYVKKENRKYSIAIGDYKELSNYIHPRLQRFGKSSIINSYRFEDLFLFADRLSSIFPKSYESVYLRRSNPTQTKENTYLKFLLIIAMLAVIVINLIKMILSISI